MDDKTDLTCIHVTKRGGMTFMSTGGALWVYSMAVIKQPDIKRKLPVKKLC